MDEHRVVTVHIFITVIILLYGAVMGGMGTQSLENGKFVNGSICSLVTAAYQLWATYSHPCASVTKQYN